MKDKKKLFVKYAYNQFNEHQLFNQLMLTVLNIRANLISDNKQFSKLSAKAQFEICSIVGVIVSQSVRDNMNNNMPLSLPKNIKFRYSVYRNENLDKSKIIDI